MACVLFAMLTPHQSRGMNCAELGERSDAKNWTRILSNSFHYFIETLNDSAKMFCSLDKVDLNLEIGTNSLFTLMVA